MEKFPTLHSCTSPSLLPPLKKGAMGDFLLILPCKIKSKSPVIASRCPPPFAKGAIKGKRA